MPTLSEGFARVSQGLIKGRVLDNNVKVFHGVPYALPPVGPLRWRYPQPPIPWSGIRPADRWGSVELQNAMGEVNYLESYGSEDCLYLNVHTPAGSETANLPVYLFIHGGGNMGGSSGHLYHGETLAQQGMVVVTINYRLNIFGFLAHPLLTEDDPNHTSGNYGVADQIAAIHWVQANIRAFGGDPSRITIGGQSAGGDGVLGVICSPLSRGAVAGALIESGVFSIEKEDMNALADAEAAGEKAISEIADVRTADDMRALPAGKLLEYAFSGKFRAQLIIDGYLLPKSIRDTFKDHDLPAMPVMFGVNSREFIAGHRPDEALSNEDYEKYARAPREKLDSVYPSATDRERLISLNEIVSDRMLASCMRLSHDVYGRQNCYLYYFQKPIPNDTDDFYGAPHSCEMPYIFGRVGYGAANPWDRREWTRWDYDTMRAFQNYLTAFVSGGKPEPKYFPDWPAYDPETESTLVIGEEPHGESNVRKAQMDALGEER